MHILFVTPVVPSPSYGRRPYNFIRSLYKDHQVHVATFLTYPKDDLIALRTLAEWGVICRAVKHPDWKGVLNCATRWPSFQPLRTLWIKSDPLQKTIQEIVRKYPIEIIHFDRMRMGHYAFGVKGIARVVDFTDALMLFLERTDTSYRSVPGKMVDCWEKKTIPRYERAILQEVETSLCCSPVDREVFERYHPGYKMGVIHNSIDTDRFVPHDRPGKGTPRLVFTGTLSYFPNLDSLLYLIDSIWPVLREKRPDLKLDIVGARPPQSVRRLAERAGIELYANVPDMAQYLYRGDLFVCPLRVASGVRNKVLEAMSCEMTTISTPVGVEGMEVEPGKHYLKAGDKEEFVSQVLRALDDAEMRKRIGHNARQYAVDRHSPQVAARALLEIYNKAQGNL